MVVAIAAFAFLTLPLHWSVPLLLGLGWLGARSRINHRRRRPGAAVQVRRQSARYVGVTRTQAGAQPGAMAYPGKSIADDLRIIRGEHLRDLPSHLLVDARRECPRAPP